MSTLLSETTTVLERAFHQLENKIDKPVLVRRGTFHFMRYRTPTAQAAIIQKLARIISGLHASSVLLSHGMFQELGAIFRMLDEFGEDALFLGQALISGKMTPLHEEYLSVFYQEEFENPGDPLGSPQKRNQISRKRIHAAIGQISENPVNPSDSQNLNRTLHQAMSGYVHGASSHIMDMYTGNPPHFHLTGMLGTPLEPQIRTLTTQYFHRGLCTVMFAALALQDHPLLKELYAYRDKFEKLAGMTDWPDPEKQIRRIKRASE
jgi:hypothetical protein